MTVPTKSSVISAISMNPKLLEDVCTVIPFPLSPLTNLATTKSPLAIFFSAAFLIIENLPSALKKTLIYAPALNFYRIELPSFISCSGSTILSKLTELLIKGDSVI
jgi:hypothetical protein